MRGRERREGIIEVEGKEVGVEQRERRSNEW